MHLAENTTLRLAFANLSLENQQKTDKCLSFEAGRFMLYTILLTGCLNTNQPLVIYSGRGESLVDDLLKQAEQDLGFDIQVQYGKSAEMVGRMLTEGKQSPADIIFTQEIGRLEALSNKDLLAPLSDSLLEPIVEQFKDDQKKWVGTSGRLRVLVYDSKVLSAADLPKSLIELANPTWQGKLGWAPTNGSFEAHVSALRHLWGEEKTKNWLQGVKANKPQVHPKNSPQVKAVDQGTLQIGWVNHYYLHKLNKETSAKNYSFPSQDGGNIMMLAGMGIRKNSEQKEKAEKLIGYILEQGQQYFIEKTFEYPTKKGLSPHPNVNQIDPSKLAPINQSHLSDVGPTVKMLQELDLQ